MTEVKIGLETHIQLDTDTKLFCGCPNEKIGKPNKNVCETCLGHPGSKPRLNKAVLDKAVQTAQALKCDVNEDIFFSRKTYFYPDMSKNYQITQYEIPVGEEGGFKLKVEDEKKKVGITRLHIEEDPAKLVHEGGDIRSSKYTKVDYNRAGTPLLEIVTEPDFESPAEARNYLQQLAQMLEYLGIYRPDSDYAIKSDANISIEGGQRVEVKNITGTKGIEQALSYEVSRQKQLKKRGLQVQQETRNYDANQKITEKLREKETEEDYGYIFDPDLTRQELDRDYRENLKQDIPELPHEKFERFREEYGLKEKIVESLISEPEIADDFEELAESHDPELTASWMTGELKKVLNYNELNYSEADIRIEWLKKLLQLLEEDQISDRNAEKLLRELVENPRNPDEIINEKDLLKAEESEISTVIEQVIQDNPEAVEDFESGDREAVNFLVGQVMQESGGKADPKTAREKILSRLE
ncbi:MAG: Asp-tRNA(Asn)/Glu-tRNA(Gln) amidotransferase subunit GatB [Candidatus Nanohaloarchaea archaeon]